MAIERLRWVKREDGTRELQSATWNGIWKCWVWNGIREIDEVDEYDDTFDY